MDKLLLGIDIGTTGTKAVIFDASGNIMGMGQSEYEVSIPNHGHAEQNPEDWWKAVCKATRVALKADLCALRA